MNNSKQQNGMILIIVLIFLLVLSMLAISTFDASYLQLRMSQNFGQEMRLLQAAEIGLRMGEQQLQAGQFVQDDIAIIYLVEPLNNDSCVWDENHHKSSGRYYRITSQANWKETARVTLQSTYAQGSAQSCLSQSAAVQMGRMSWRELQGKF